MFFIIIIFLVLLLQDQGIEFITEQTIHIIHFLNHQNFHLHLFQKFCSKN